MTDVDEKEVFRSKAIALINEYRQVRGLKPIDWLVIDTPEISAFIRSIQLHEKTKKELADFKQKVSDAVENVQTPVEIICPCTRKHVVAFNLFDHLISPKPKRDPLVAAMEKMGWYIAPNGPADAENFRAALDDLGFEIREKKNAE
jgi:hypothetical protein